MSAISAYPTALVRLHSACSKGDILAKAGAAYGKCLRIYQKHSDLVSSCTNLTLNTILLASKIFREIPPLVSRTSLVLLNYTGIIWLNVQARSFKKSCRDFQFAYREGDFWGMALTAGKVMVKGSNILFTAALFGASVFSLAGFPAAALQIYALMRTPALAGWILDIGNEISDYRQNRSLLKEMTALKTVPDGDIKIQLVVRNFLQMIEPESKNSLLSLPPALQKLDSKEKKTALRILRQSEEYLLSTYKESLKGKLYLSDNKQTLSGLNEKETKLFYAVLADGLRGRQDLTRANLGLIILGYLSLGVCRLYPATVIQYGVTWGMSMLYTGKLVYQKLHNHWLSRRIT